MFNKLKQTKDMIGKVKEMKKLQTELAADVTEETKDGVTIQMDGSLKTKAVKISDDSLLSDKARLESAIVSAINHTQEKVQKQMAKKIQDMGGLDFPGM